MNVFVLFGDRYEIWAEKDSFDTIDAKQLSMEPSRSDDGEALEQDAIIYLASGEE